LQQRVTRLHGLPEDPLLLVGRSSHPTTAVDEDDGLYEASTWHDGARVYHDAWGQI